MSELQDSSIPKLPDGGLSTSRDLKFRNNNQNISTSNASHKWLLLLVISWVVGVFYAFSIFLLADYRLFYQTDQERLVEFEKTDFAKGLEGYLFDKGLIPAKTDNFLQTLPQVKGHVFHFWNPGCSCDRANFAHVNKLIRQYSQQGMNFYIVLNNGIRGNGVSEGSKDWEQLKQQYPDRIRIVPESELSPAKEGLSIPASPSAAVLNANGKLLYFGPYALGGVCRPDENGLIETVLKGTLNGMPPKYSYVGGFGCFCSWRGE